MVPGRPVPPPVDGGELPTAWLRLIAANRPRYGGYIVHLAVVMVALGIVGTTFFGTQRDVVLSPGQSVSIGDYELRYLETVELPRGNRTEFVSTVVVYRDGRQLDILYPGGTSTLRLTWPPPGRHPLHAGGGPLRGPQ